MTTSQLSLSRWIRLTGDVEGISYLVLLAIAMPLKYMAGMPGAVRYVGMAHGLLFVLFMLMLFAGWNKLNWTFGRVAFAFVLSMIPFGTFYLHRILAREETEPAGHTVN
jgi:integral membrane protein